MILSLDLGANFSVACQFVAATGEASYQRIPTTRVAIEQLLSSLRPERLVIEIGPQAGWVHDVAVRLGIPVQIANPNHEGWRWRKVKRKTDRADALKLAQLSSMNQLPKVYMPAKHVREWRSFIRYRHRLVSKRVAIKNQIRSLLLREGLKLPASKQGWNQESIEHLRTLAAPLDDLKLENLWRGQLTICLMELDQVESVLRKVEQKLDTIAKENAQVRLLRSVPGVGIRMSELLVAIIDNPHRFTSSRQVASYAGLTPKQYQSGELTIHGKISKQGDGLLRMLLVEVSWLGLQHNSWVKDLFVRTKRGTAQRNKLAIIAVARRLLVRCWAMLRDGTRWEPRGALAG